MDRTWYQGSRFVALDKPGTASGVLVDMLIEGLRIAEAPFVGEPSSTLPVGLLAGRGHKAWKEKKFF